MEAFGVLFALILVGVVIILPIWVILAVLNLRRRAESDRQQSNQHWQDLTIRVHLLETHLKELKQARAASPEESHEARESKPPTPAAAVLAEVASPLVRPVPPPVPAPLSPRVLLRLLSVRRRRPLLLRHTPGLRFVPARPAADWISRKCSAPTG